jgi:hypothetical protein
MEYLLGLDLGQSEDPSALCIIERTVRCPRGCDPETTEGIGHYAVRHIVRWPLGTSYTRVVQDVVGMLDRPPLPGSTLLVDATGVGRAVVDQFKDALRRHSRQARRPANLVPVVITGGTNAHYEDHVWRVPKRDLAGTLTALLGERRLTVSEMQDREVLLREMRTFTLKVDPRTGHESFAHWRERDHDDVLLASVLPLWYCERTRRKRPMVRIYEVNRGRNWLPPRIRVVACGKEDLQRLDVDGRRLLVYATDPSPVGAEAVPPHTLPNVLGSLVVGFLDSTPDDHAATWTAPVPPWGKTAEELLMDKVAGKRMWAFLTKHRDPGPHVIIFADDGATDRRALSLAYAFCDLSGLPRESVWRVGCEDDDSEGEVNPHVLAVSRDSRSLVY